MEHHEHDHHGHHHHHVPDLKRINQAFYVGIGANALYTINEFVVGIRINSLALISDASHNLSDVATLIISLLGMKLAQSGDTKLYTYGYKKAETLFKKDYVKDKGHIKEASSMKLVLEGKLLYLKMVKGEQDPTYLKLQDRFNKAFGLDIEKLLQVWEAYGIEKAEQVYRKMGIENFKICLGVTRKRSLCLKAFRSYRGKSSKYYSYFRTIWSEK